MCNLPDRILDCSLFIRFLRGVVQNDSAGLQYIPAVRYVQCHVRILLDKQKSSSRSIDLADDVEDFALPTSAQAQRRFVEQKQLRLAITPVKSLASVVHAAECSA